MLHVMKPCKCLKPHSDLMCDIMVFRFDIMTQCWADKAESRPTFSAIVILLSQYLEKISNYTILMAKNEAEDIL